MLGAYWTSELNDTTQSGQRPVVSLEDAMSVDGDTFPLYFCVVESPI
jgi:hypothetical protein